MAVKMVCKYVSKFTY